jgi:hypothetical protein
MHRRREASSLIGRARSRARAAVRWRSRLALLLGALLVSPMAGNAIGGSIAAAAASPAAHAMRGPRPSARSGAAHARRRHARAPVDTRGNPVDPIEAAVTAHRLGFQEGLLDRVYRATGDSRLPRQFRGSSDAGAGDDMVLVEAAGAWRNLSARIRRQLLPFFIATATTARRKLPRRASRASPSAFAAGGAVPDCTAAADGWTYADAAHTPVRIWSGTEPAERSLAAYLSQQMDAAIWPTLTAIMGRTPLLAKSPNCREDRVDVTLTDSLGYGALGLIQPKTNEPLTVLGDFACGDPYAGSIELRYTGNRRQMRDVLAHEFFHLLQATYTFSSGCDDAWWLIEGSATWAEDRVYPGDHPANAFDTLITRPQDSLYSPSRLHEQSLYGTWAFFRYLEKIVGESTIANIFAGLSGSSSLAATDTAIGGFQNRWPDFARYGWNQAPVSGSFRQWDGLRAIPASLDNALSLKLHGKHSGDVADLGYELTGGLQPLARQYTPFQVEDGKIRQLTFHNTLARETNADVHAFIDGAGGWRTENWTGQADVHLCVERDKISRFVVVYSNSALPPGPRLTSETPSVELSDARCKWPTTIQITEIIATVPVYEDPGNTLTWRSTWHQDAGRCSGDENACYYHLDSGTVTLSAGIYRGLVGIDGNGPTPQCHYPAVTTPISWTPVPLVQGPNEVALSYPTDASPGTLQILLSSEPVTQAPDYCQNTNERPVLRFSLARPAASLGGPWDGEETSWSWHSTPDPEDGSYVSAEYQLSY